MADTGQCHLRVAETLRYVKQPSDIVCHPSSPVPFLKQVDLFSRFSTIYQRIQQTKKVWDVPWSLRSFGSHCNFHILTLLYNYLKQYQCPYLQYF